MTVATEPCKQQIAKGTEHGAQHQDAHHTPAQRHHAANERAQQGHEHAIDLGHGGHFCFGVTHVNIKGIGHDAHHHIADAIDRDQAQNQCGLPFVALEKIGKGFNQRTLQPFLDVSGRRQLGLRWFFGHQHRDTAHQHAGRHHQISGLPSCMHVTCGAFTLHPSRHPQNTRAGPNHGQAITRLITGCQSGLLRWIGRLNSKCIQGNILGGRANGYQQSTPHHRPQGLRWVTECHAHQTHHHHALRQQQPTAATAKLMREERNGQAIDQWRPDPFETVGQTNPAEVANGAAIDARLAQSET